MKIKFSSIRKSGDYIYYEVAPKRKQQSYGNFVICSVDKGDFKPGATTIKGKIDGAAIVLIADSKQLPYQLRLGNKSINQLRLWQYGYHIPATVVLDFSICDQFKRDGETNLQNIYEQVAASRLGSSVAIRCSSNLEDSDVQSFAGFFDTYLNVPNQSDEIQKRIFQSYRKFCFKGGIEIEGFQQDIRLSIMIQQMLQPKLSGFLFTLDPTNPPSNRLKIEYWHGSRGHSDAYSIALNRETGKQIDSDQDRSQSSNLIASQKILHHAAIEIERCFGTPQDIEFLISGGKDTLYLVQSRPITAFSYSPDHVSINEQKKLLEIRQENQLFGQEPILSSTNILELFNRAIPLGYSIFKYGFAGTSELDGGISIGRSKIGYAKLEPEARTNLFYTVADQARTNLIVDALTFRLPGISKHEYLNIFVKHYLERVRHDPFAANYPEDGLYLQSVDPARWLEIAGTRGEHFYGQFSEFLQQIIQVHAPREYRNAGKFFRQNDRRYRTYLERNLQITSQKKLKHYIDDLLLYFRTVFCPQYVIYARLAFLCTHIAKEKLGKLVGTQGVFSAETILNELLCNVKIHPGLAGHQYPVFERLYKQGRITLAELLYHFQHLGSLDIAQPRLGEYSPEKLCEVFGLDNTHGFKADAEPNLGEHTGIDFAKIGIVNDPAFRTLYTYAGQFMRLRERAKGELLKLLWALKRMLRELAWRNRFDDLIYYLELNEVLTLDFENRNELRLIALQRKAYLEACRQHQVKNVLLNLESTPFEKKSFFDTPEGENHYRFVLGKAIFHGHAEGFCLTANSNEEFIKKLVVFKEKNIENIIGIFKGIEPSYFNISALTGFTTESGGYLSHAATIAREFRLPYISGINLDQFRDEDYVILDTENNQAIIRR